MGRKKKRFLLFASSSVPPNFCIPSIPVASAKGPYTIREVFIHVVFGRTSNIGTSKYVLVPSAQKGDADAVIVLRS